MARDEIKQLAKRVVVLDKHLQDLLPVSIVEMGPVQLNEFVGHGCLHSLLLVAHDRVDAMLETVYQSLGQLALVVFGLLVLKKPALHLIFHLFAADFGLEVLDHVESTQQVFLEVALDEEGKVGGPVLALVEGVLDILAETLVVVLGLVEAAGPLSFSESSDLLVHELGFDARLRHGFLNVLLLQVGVWLVGFELIRAVVVVGHVAVAYLVCRQAAFIRLNRTDVEERVLAGRIFVAVGVGEVLVGLAGRHKWGLDGCRLHCLLH